MERSTVFSILDGERIYQEERWKESGKNKPIESYMVYMQSYLNDAMREITHESNSKTLDTLRKVVALGIAAFEEHGVPKRETDGKIYGSGSTKN
jgi:hypothetical protein